VKLHLSHSRMILKDKETAVLQNLAYPVFIINGTSMLLPRSPRCVLFIDMCLCR
jgi:hypothetical protein